MLNYNKIRSSMNHSDSNNLELMNYLHIKESTFYDKLKRKSFTPNEIELFADYFKKPIAYYFDKEENSVNESAEKYNVKMIHCTECISKQKEIDALKLALEAKEELLDIYRGKKDKDCG